MWSAIGVSAFTVACSSPAPSLELQVAPVEATAENFRALSDYQAYDLNQIDDGLRTKCATGEPVQNEFPSQYAVVQISPKSLHAPSLYLNLSNGIVVDPAIKGPLIIGLYDVLIQIADDHSQAAKLACIPQGLPRLLLVVDGRVPLQTVAQVVYTAQQANFGMRTDLAVADPLASDRLLPSVSGRAPNTTQLRTTMSPFRRCPDRVELVHGQGEVIGLQPHPSDEAIHPVALNFVFESRELFEVGAGAAMASLNRLERPPIELVVPSGTLQDAMAIQGLLEAAEVRADVVASWHVSPTDPASPPTPPTTLRTLSERAWVPVRAPPEFQDQTHCVDLAGQVRDPDPSQCSEKSSDFRNCEQESHQARLRQADTRGHLSQVELFNGSPQFDPTDLEQDAAKCADLWFQGESVELTIDIGLNCSTDNKPIREHTTSVRSGPADQASFAACVKHSFRTYRETCPSEPIVATVSVWQRGE